MTNSMDPRMDLVTDSTALIVDDVSENERTPLCHKIAGSSSMYSWKDTPIEIPFVEPLAEQLLDTFKNAMGDQEDLHWERVAPHFKRGAVWHCVLSSSSFMWGSFRISPSRRHFPRASWERRFDAQTGRKVSCWSTERTRFRQHRNCFSRWILSHRRSFKKKFRTLVKERSFYSNSF